MIDDRPNWKRRGGSKEESDLKEITCGNPATVIVRVYAFALLFVGLFVLVLVFGPRLSPALTEPVWAAVIALVLTVPALLPTVIQDVLPRIHSVKISEIEIALQDIQASGDAISKAAQMLSSNLQHNPALNEFAGMMTSLSGSIIEAVNTVQQERLAVLPVDLATPWVVPNLYFLSLLATQKTRVEQFVFVESRLEKDRFVCSCSPLDIVLTLEWRYPELREAAQAARFDLALQAVQHSVGQEFFGRLSQIYNSRPTSGSDRVSSLTADSLLWHLGNTAHLDSLQWSTPPGEKQYRAVLVCEAPYVAALNGSQLLFLVSREKVATAVAKTLISS